jgi:hypothetical protein
VWGKCSTPTRPDAWKIEMEDSMKKMTDMSELTDRAEDRMFPADDMITEYRATQIMRNRTKVLKAMAQEAGQK